MSLEHSIFNGCISLYTWCMCYNLLNKFSIRLLVFFSLFICKHSWCLTPLSFFVITSLAKFLAECNCSRCTYLIFDIDFRLHFTKVYWFKLLPVMDKRAGLLTFLQKQNLSHILIFVILWLKNDGSFLFHLHFFDF